MLTFLTRLQTKLVFVTVLLLVNQLCCMFCVVSMAETAPKQSLMSVC